MAQIDGAGQQDTDNQNAEALQAALAQREVTAQAQPQGGSDVPSHQNSDPIERRIGNSTAPSGSYQKTSCTVGTVVADHASGEGGEDWREGDRSRYTVFQMAEVVVPRDLFRRILGLIDELRPRQVTRCRACRWRRSPWGLRDCQGLTAVSERSLGRIVKVRSP